jgi:mannose-6-phosphate isomerase-like protein (cupin superfamily)
MRRNADIENTETSFGSMRWVADEMSAGTGITVGRVVIEPGKANQRHAHPDCEEVLYLMAGRLEHSFGKEIVAMGAGDTIVIPPGTNHNARSVGDVAADMIVAYSSGRRGYVPENGTGEE